ncbi:hypothetical protein RBB78_14330 [Tunturiibacter empetritectus]|uniref:hypothetical protein n=1 Tax=Tunturiibacter empetritectus TaxID=3069691 RepID=UPI003D9BD894
MKLSYLALPVVTAACLLTAGCASHTAYYAPPPPPAGYNSVPPLIERADQVGFRSGTEDGGAMLTTDSAIIRSMIGSFTALLATTRRWGRMSLTAMPFGELICAATTRDSIAASLSRRLVSCVV